MKPPNILPPATAAFLRTGRGGASPCLNFRADHCSLRYGVFGGRAGVPTGLPVARITLFAASRTRRNGTSARRPDAAPTRPLRDRFSFGRRQAGRVWRARRRANGMARDVRPAALTAIARTAIPRVGDGRANRAAGGDEQETLIEKLFGAVAIPPAHIHKLRATRTYVRTAAVIRVLSRPADRRAVNRPAATCGRRAAELGTGRAVLSTSRPAGETAISFFSPTGRRRRAQTTGRSLSGQRWPTETCPGRR